MGAATVDNAGCFFGRLLAQRLQRAERPLGDFSPLPVSPNILPGHRGAHAGRHDAYQGYWPAMGRCLAWRPRSIERSLGVIAGRSSVVHWPRGSRTSPPRRRSRRACGQHGKRDREPRGCREPPRMDGRPRYSIPGAAHWPPPEPASTSIGLLDGRADRQESGAGRRGPRYTAM